MRVHVHPADAGGCGHYRMIWPAQALKDQGHDVTIMTPDTEESTIRTQMTRDRNGVERVVGLADKPDCDVLVLQRPLQRLLLETIPHLRKAGIAVVVELDDDFENIHPQNVAWSHAHPNMSPDRNWRWLKKACQAANVTTVSTRSLRSYRSNAILLPNFVPQWYTEVPTPEWEDPPAIGWSGSVATHPHDLPEADAVRKMINNGEYQFRVVGTGKDVAKELGLHGTVDMHPSGWVDIGQYPFEMAKINVGLVPLKANQFNQAKSWLKGLEWAALGVPFIASPTESYLALEGLGIGQVCLSHKHWPHMVRNQTPEMGQKYRQMVIDLEMTIEQQAHMWWKTWAFALQHNRENRL